MPRDGLNDAKRDVSRPRYQVGHVSDAMAAERLAPGLPADPSRGASFVLRALPSCAARRGERDPVPPLGDR